MSVKRMARGGRAVMGGTALAMAGLALPAGASAADRRGLCLSPGARRAKAGKAL